MANCHIQSACKTQHHCYCNSAVYTAKIEGKNNSIYVPSHVSVAIQPTMDRSSNSSYSRGITARVWLLLKAARKSILGMPNCDTMEGVT